MLHCALSVIHDVYYCRHNSNIYAVSKQNKHHSTYPSMCHCYEPGHFSTFSPRFHFNTTFTYKTTFHKQSGQTLCSNLCWCTELFVCISDINSMYFGNWWRRVWGSRLSIYHPTASRMLFQLGSLWRSWLRHCISSRNFASSNPGGATGDIYLYFPAALRLWGRHSI
jgi:hypothetical protein